ncbi:MAG: hypothetical protein OEW62_00170 [Candidatus Bathyarchaeota archaeon]|nr:hypothetical protein [Candidatus Bathyarchaeota archaeon]MDH5745366.1 hypothetical protein [Candidatus Bathyarchaeota archaeon]
MHADVRKKTGGMPLKMQKHKFKMYARLFKKKSQILEEANEAAKAIGIPKELKGQIGLYGGDSSVPKPLVKEIRRSVAEVQKKTIKNKILLDQLREIVKDFYGDMYDAVPVSTCEAGLWIAFDVLVSPPFQGRGQSYRGRYIVPYERVLRYHGAFGRPFPPKYKDLYTDRGVESGQFGFSGKILCDLDTIIVPLIGAKYEPHGIKYYTATLLSKVDPKASAKEMEEVARRHAPFLTAFCSLGYDTPGYGYGIKDERGTPLLQKLIGKLADEFDVPYITDNAMGVPVFGTDLRKTGADLILYSMDKSLAPTSGLIIGKEDLMVQIRRALGMTSPGKAAYTFADAGKDAIAGQIAMLKMLRDKPKEILKPIDELYKIVIDEFDGIEPHLKEGIIISKSINTRGVEIDYEGTWKDGEFGIPIFSAEDSVFGTNLIVLALKRMGILPSITYDGNLWIDPGQGTTDDEGQLIEKRMRMAVRGLVKSLEIVSKWAGIIK